uniref:COMM domain-containing protein n=1 Tax=Peronospora matthiolae TaxID=2874970 RepID=A0AAV1TGN4_9STRA
MMELENDHIDDILYVANDVFEDAATFRHIDQNLLLSHDVNDNVVHAVEKAWKKAGSVEAEHAVAAQKVRMPSLVLQKTDWRLHLQMGSSKRAGYLQPMAIFQLDVMDERSKTKQTERLDVELSHEELRLFFLQLNGIQAELDAFPTPPTDLAL